MTIIEFKDVSKTFFSQNLYKHVDLEINSSDKIALVGNNGTGKSTLIKLITGAEYPDRGTVTRDESAVITCFDQFGRVNLESKVQDLLDSPFKRVMAVQVELDAVSAQFTGDADNDEKVMEQYSKISDEFESLGGYSYIHVQSEFIDTFELTDKLDKKFKELSGGERQYIRLATTLFSESDLIILDEPLSFFDKRKTAWLTDYINGSPKAFLVISHNIDFIKTFSNKIFDIDNFEVGVYECTHPNFLKEKKIRIAESKKKNRETEEVIGTTEEAVEKKLKLLEKCNNKHAHAVILRRMRKELIRLQKERIKFSPEYQYDYIDAPEDVMITGKKSFEGPIVVLNDVMKEYPDKVLFKNGNLVVDRDTKICIVGENGSGKSSLLKIIAGLDTPTSGEVFINEKATIAFIEQEAIFPNENIYISQYLKDKTGLSDEFIEAAIDSLYNNEIEFRDKRIFMLSGGEKKRLEIFTNTLMETDLLIIDEPTTYMDDYSRTAIANMLLDYPGAVILVSHDKVLMRRIGFVTYDIRDNRFRVKNF
ncbi:MAG: ATP-binding cassette domain-containing protein [Cetobacterium sp.]